MDRIIHKIYWPEQSKSSELLKSIRKENPEINEKMDKLLEYVSYKWHGDFIELK